MTPKLNFQADQTLVLTGSAGFVGENLALAAIKLGYTVIGIDLKTSLVLQCQQYVVDVSCEPIAQYVPRGATIIHLASLSTDSLCRENPILAIDANIKATASVVGASQESGASQLIFASSEWVYPEKSHSIDQLETDRLSLSDLNSLYAMSKLIGESIIRTTSSTAYSLLRFGIVFGPRPFPGSAVESLALKVHKGELVNVGSGSTARRFIYIDDLVEAILRVVAFGPVSEGGVSLNIAGSELISLSKVVETTNKILGKSVAIIDGGNPPSIRNPLINRAHSLIDWQPRTEFSTGIQNCLQSMTYLAN